MYYLVNLSALLAILCSFVVDCLAGNVTRLVQPSPSGEMLRLRKATPSVSAKTDLNLNYSSYFVQVDNNNTQERRLLKSSMNYVNSTRKTSSFWAQPLSTFAPKIQRTKVKSIISSISIGGFRNGSYIAASSTQLNFNSTATINAGNKTNSKSNCSQRKTCSQRYGARWLKFYVEIGGWIMLAVVLSGITALIVTHILGRRHINLNDFTTVRESDLRYKGSWI